MRNSTAFAVGPQLTRLIAERAPRVTLRLRTITVPTQSPFSPYPRERLHNDRCVMVASSDKRARPADHKGCAVPEEEGVTYRVGRLNSDFLLVPFLVARAGAVAHPAEAVRSAAAPSWC